MKEKNQERVIEMDVVGEQVNKAENKTDIKKDKKCSGLDIGTANLLCARESNGAVVIKLQRDAFIDIEKTDFTRKMLEKMNASENFEPKPEKNEKSFFDKVREMFS